MNIKDYEAYVESRCQSYVDLPYLVVALNEEAGEVAGWFKKFVLRANPTGLLSQLDLKSELGDVLFYLTRLANHFGWSLEDIMDYNKEKLDRRVTSKIRSVV